jgi:hypothetical protein
LLIQVNPSKFKMPSTPVDSPFDDNFGDINSPDRSSAPSLFLRHQQIKNVFNTAEVLEQRLNKSFKMLNISTPDSDHSSDHDVSPKIQRRRKTNVIAASAAVADERFNLPKLSISVDQDQSSSSLSQSNQMLTSPLIITEKKKLTSSDSSKRVMKSASAVDLSLKVSPSFLEKVPENTRRDRTRLKLDTNLCESSFKSDVDISDMPLPRLPSSSNINHSNSNNNNGGSSTASSREVSPSREGPTISNLKPPVILRRGPNGFGFVIQTIREFFLQI